MEKDHTTSVEVAEQFYPRARDRNLPARDRKDQIRRENWGCSEVVGGEPKSEAVKCFGSMKPWDEASAERTAVGTGIFTIFKILAGDSQLKDCPDPLESGVRIEVDVADANSFIWP